MTDVFETWIAERQRLERQIARLAEQMAEAEARMQRLDIAIEEYAKATGSHTGARIVKPAEPTNDELVAKIVEEHDDEIQDTEILRIMQENGWTTGSTDPLNLIRSYLSRLARSGRIEKRGRARYRRLSHAQADRGPTSTAGPLQRLLTEKGGETDDSRNHRNPPLVGDR